MPTKKTKRKWVDSEDFYVARRRAGLTPGQAADMLQVTKRTIQNWENETSQIPYSAFRLMRVYAGHAIVHPVWDGWTIWQGVLYSPAGRAFEPYQLVYLSNYLWMARQWLQERSAANPLTPKPLNQTPSAHQPLVDVAPSDAPASLDAQGQHRQHGLKSNVVSLQRKTSQLLTFENSPHFRTIVEAANDVLESEVQ